MDYPDFLTATAPEVDVLIPTQERIKQMLASLPVLRKEELDLEESCPICLVSFRAVFEEEEQENEKQSGKTQAGGVTKLVGCRHVFCRKDLTEWIRSQHGSCPTCRNTFLHIHPSESDDESSDGGEYIPNPDEFEEEDEDPFVDTDGFTDASADEFPVEYMELDVNELWEEEEIRLAAQEELDAMWDDNDGLEQEEADDDLYTGLAVEEEDVSEDHNSLSAYQEQEEGEEGLHAGLAIEEDIPTFTEEGIDSFSYEADHISEVGLTDGESDPMSSCSEGDGSWGEFEERTRVEVALQREVSIPASMSGIGEAQGMGEFEDELDPKCTL